MREDVLIVLNEREPAKAQMAAELDQQLLLRNLTSSRIEPSANLAKIIQERNPRVLVLDFILADISTALDILTELSRETGESIQTIIWTDEPSVSVAVSAMKLGAIDYIESNATRSLEKVIRAIDTALDKTAKVSDTKRMRPVQTKWTTPIGQSPRFRDSLDIASRAARRDAQTVVLEGPSGCGRNTVARFIHQCRDGCGQYLEFQAESFIEPMNRLFGGDRETLATPYLSASATVVIDHVESEMVELLEAAERFEWPTKQSPMLVIGTSSPEVSRAWSTIVDAEHIVIPSLSDRPEDILILSQAFLDEASELSTTLPLPLTAPLLSWLQSLDWPGNVRQLRQAIIDTWTFDQPTLERLIRRESHLSEFSKLDEALHPIACAILHSKERWEQANQSLAPTVRPLQARRALDASLGNIRIAAASLGTSVRVIQKSLDSWSEQVSLNDKP